MAETSAGFDLFITCAWEDKSFADRLAYFLIDAGLNIWSEHTMLQQHHHLAATINEGFMHAPSGIVILSRSFFAKNSREETIGLLNKERPGNTLIPVWHDIPYRDVEDIVQRLTDRQVSSSEQHSLDRIIEDILKVALSDKKGNIPSGIIESTSINNTKLITLPLRPYNDWAVAVGHHPVTNKQYSNFLKNVKSDLLDEIIHNHVAETINVNYLKSNFHKPCGKLMEDGREHDIFFPLDDPRFSHPDSPVVCVSLIEALGYVSWLNSELNFKGFIFTLISPRLWRYAAFGDQGQYADAIEEITQANMVHRTDRPMPVTKTADRNNASGISDMFGNVWEWCEPEIMGKDEEQEQVLKTVAEIAGGGYAYDLEHIAPFLSSEMLEDGIFTKRSDLGFRIAALVNVKNIDGKVREQLNAAEGTAAPFIEQYFNRNYKYY